MIYPLLVEFRNFQIISGLRKLEKLLAQRKWGEADEQTGRVMFTILGLDPNHRQDNYIDNCKNFPPEPLKVIDNLWVKYSKGHLGFSVQKQIWKECEQILAERAECGYDYRTHPNPPITWLFGDRVGWRTEDWDEKEKLIKRVWRSFDKYRYNPQAIGPAVDKGQLPFLAMFWIGESCHVSVRSTNTAAGMLCHHFFPSHPEIDQIPDLDNLQINYTKLKHSLVYMDQGKVIKAWKLNYVNLTIVILSGLVLINLGKYLLEHFIPYIPYAIKMCQAGARVWSQSCYPNYGFFEGFFAGIFAVVLVIPVLLLLLIFPDLYWFFSSNFDISWLGKPSSDFIRSMHEMHGALFWNLWIAFRSYGIIFVFTEFWSPEFWSFIASVYKESVENLLKFIYKT